MTDALTRQADIRWFLDHPEARAYFRLLSADEKVAHPDATVQLIEHHGRDHRRTYLRAELELVDYVLREGEACLGRGHWIEGSQDRKALVEIVLADGKTRTLN